MALTFRFQFRRAKAIAGERLHRRLTVAVGEVVIELEDAAVAVAEPGEAAPIRDLVIARRGSRSDGEKSAP